MGHPLLRLKAAPLSLEEILSEETKSLIQDMESTMKESEGIGIAAPQIGVSKQVALVGIEKENSRYPNIPEYNLITIINPGIKVLDKKLQGHWEGCLSVPGLRGFVERPRKVKVTFQNIKGEACSIIAEDFMAAVFQHEIDHLFGKLYVDRIKNSKKLSYIEEFEEFIDSC